MGVDYWDIDTWKKIFDGTDVIVLTAQILYHLLSHGFINISEIGLLIFDECHHTRKRHPYNAIMTDFYFNAPIKVRPKIFGMTASPVNRSVDFGKSLRLLENNLDAKAFTVSHCRNEDLRTNAPKPKERLIQYASYRYPDDGPLISRFSSLGLDLYSTWWQRFMESYERVIRECGPHFCDLAMYVELKELRKRYKIKRQLDSGLSIQQITNEDRELRELIGSEYRLMRSQSAKRLIFLQELDKTQQGTLYRFLEETLDHLKPTEQSEWDKHSPKLQLLLDNLQEYAQRQGKEFCCMVFTERRSTAVILSDLINMQFADLREIRIKSRALVGQESMNTVEQNRVLHDFRQGAVNVLVATSVAEEGLDIASCSLVIRFNLFNTLIEYIQSRGRARKPNSEFLIFMELNNYEENDRLSKIRHAEFEMNHWRTKSHTNEDDTYNIFEDSFDETEECSAELEEIFEIPATGSAVSLNSSVQLVFLYCASALGDEFNPAPVPQFFVTEQPGLGFTSKILMPSGCPRRISQGRAMPNQSMAKKSAALEMCKHLYSIGELDENLLPRRQPKANLNLSRLDMMMQLLEDMDVAESDLPEARAQICQWSQRAPWTAVDWQMVEENDANRRQFVTFAYELRLTDVEAAKVRYAPLMILLPLELSELPVFPLYVPESESSPQCVRINASIRKICAADNGGNRLLISEEEMKRLRRFNSFIMRYVFLSNRDNNQITDNRPDYIWERCRFDDWDERYIYLSCPYAGIDHSAIDWQMIDRIFAMEQLFQQQQQSPDGNEDYAGGDIWSIMQQLDPAQQPSEMEGEGIVELVGTDILDYQKRVIVRRVDRRFNSQSAVCEAAANEPAFCKSKFNYEQLYRAVYRHIPYTQRLLPTFIIDQPLVDTARIPRLRNYLQPDNSPSEKQKASARSKLPNLRLPQFIIFNPIPADLFRSVSLLPSIFSRMDPLCNVYDFHEAFGFRHISSLLILEALTTPASGLGYSYERLETLGDAFIKFLIGLHLFALHPDKHEGNLSYTRHLQVSNKSLYQRAVSSGLQKYIWNASVQNKQYRLPLVNQEPVERILQSEILPTSKAKRAASLPSVNSNLVADCTIADVFEACVGAAFVGGEVEKAFGMAKFLNLPLEGINAWSEYWPLLNRQIDDRQLMEQRIVAMRAIQRDKLLPVRTVQQIIGYEFRNVRLLEEAMNHASSTFDFLQSYQRLEFLGDSILDMLVVQFLFDLNYATGQLAIEHPSTAGPAPESQLTPRYADDNLQAPMDPGRLTLMKGLIVSNETLAFALSASGLSKHILHFSDALLHTIGSYDEWASKIMESENPLEYAQEVNNLPWWWWWRQRQQDEEHEMEQSAETEQSVSDDQQVNCASDCETIKDLLPSQPAKEPRPSPKVLGDVFEAIIAAVYLDSEIDLQKTFGVCNRLLRLDSRRVDPTITSDNARSELQYFDRWIGSNAYDAFYKHSHPRKKLLEWSDSRNCTGLIERKFPVHQKHSEFSKILGDDAQVNYDTIEADGEFANAEYAKREPSDVNDDEFMALIRQVSVLCADADLPRFNQSAVGIYLHGLLIGVARAQSYTQAYMAAARQALSVVERMIQRSLVLDCVDGNISLLPMTEESKASALNFGTSCRLCLKSANSR